MNRYKTKVTAFCFSLLTIYRSVRIASSKRNANDRTPSSIFLFRITLAAIISSNHSYRYTHFCPPNFFHEGM